MSLTTEQCRTMLTERGIIPKVLPDTINLRGTVEVVYPQGRVTCGEVLDREHTQVQPEVIFNAAESDAYYTIIMTDPDLLMENDKLSGQVRHWLQSNVQFDSSGKAVFKQEATTNYLGCAPGLGTGKHRYVFIVAQQPGPRPGTALDPPAVTELTTGGPDADLKSRVGFDAAKYISNAALDVVGVTYMEVAPNVASTLKDVELVAKSAANKVMGQ
ncbi:hypothetical protein BOTBODRAFT_37962 [Botryobasidium botryosum FD-172 SS1]|uniref:PEBP-like protein n=1 Tax=Botryobasidium botryosum (strain FD-172 SS1) TaxID=930990 RepID=A0A067LYR7_BOTB1|nr:hypothetical protein BOTBODRAFT_37962 [Botryobasidium botryosum FD-172 SS1]